MPNDKETSRRQSREGSSRTARRRASEKSDDRIVPKKRRNTLVTGEDGVEGRRKANGNLAPGGVRRTQGRTNVPAYLTRVGHAAKQEKDRKLNNLMCHLKVPLLRLAFASLKKNAAPGVDGETWREYESALDERLVELQDRIHRGSYHPKPVRRVYIPKGDGRLRPLGIPALEDKIVQQAVRMVLEPIYEGMFMGFSYGFRPGRSPHRALDALAVAIMKRRTNWVLDADIKTFFDSVDHEKMKAFLEHRIGDKRLVQLLMKWLQAGVMEQGEVQEVTSGTPQGGVISPLLANIYLHYAFDLWIHRWRKLEAKGEVCVVRYADDFVVCLQERSEAEALKTALELRLHKFGLELHPEKTRLIAFGRYARDRNARIGLNRPETFDFLGFTHIGTYHSNGFTLVRRTMRKKRQAKLVAVREELRKRRHAPVSETHGWLTSVLTGHFRYYGVPTNLRGLRSFRGYVEGYWHRQLSRRSQKSRLTVDDMKKLAKRFPLPRSKIYHPYPEMRFFAASP